MTAFARIERSSDDFQIIIEIRAVNSKALDIHLRLSPIYYGLEDNIKKCIGTYVQRGRIDLNLQINSSNNELNDFEIDWVRAEKFYNVLMQLNEKFDLQSSLTLENFIRVGNIIKPVETEKDLEEIWKHILPCLQDALVALNDMKEKEGSNLACDITKRLDYLETCVDQIESLSDNELPRYQEKLQERIAKLVQKAFEIDPVRLIQEAAYLAERSDITEEITRLRSHIQQLRDLIQMNNAIGRKINFLLQELARELNTIGSKTTQIEVSQLIVDMKTEQEKIREQVQNIE